MIDVKSYIKKENKITSLNNIETEPLQYFNSFDCIECLNYIKDFNYIEGAIIITYNGNRIMGFRYWDLADQLWSYFLSAIETLAEKVDCVSFYFPDQPIEVKIELIAPEQILFSIANQKISLPKNEFLLGLLKGAKNFFELLKGYSANYDVELNRIKKLLYILNLENL